MEPPASASNRPAAARPARVRTSERLLEEAAALFREKGYAAATTRELSDRLGIRKASLYHHIESKEALLRALCLESIARVSRAVAEAAAAAPPQERLRRAVEAHLVTMLADRDMHETVLFELRQLSAEHLAEALAARGAYEAQLREIVEAEQAAGRLRTDLPARQLTLTLLGVLNWSTLWYTPDGDSDPHELSARFYSIFVDGAGAGDKPGGPATAA